VAVATAALLYAVKILYMARQTPVELIACIDVEQAWMSWTCKEVLFHGGINQAKIIDLNSQAGALYAVSVSNKLEAEELLTFLESAGVDVNARDVKAKGRTALHSTVASGNVWQSVLLLRHGARIDIADESGVTPLLLARALVKQYPDRQEYKDVLDVLERSSATASR
jgi:ankyrin repeat protein